MYLTRPEGEYALVDPYFRLDEPRCLATFRIYQTDRVRELARHQARTGTACYQKPPVGFMPSHTAMVLNTLCHLLFNSDVKAAMGHVYRTESAATWLLTFYREKQK